MNMLFLLQFLHMFGPNLPINPSLNWKFAVISLVANSKETHKQSYMYASYSDTLARFAYSMKVSETQR